jgi:hypothetical protein
MEEWREIQDFPYYRVSNLGNIKNIVTNKVLKNNNKCGYLNISLNSNIKKKSCFKVHRLVALAFIPNPENKSDVNHKDKNKANNNLENLEWMTRKENNIHRFIGVKITTNKNKPVLKIDKITNEVLEKYNSIELAGIWLFENNYTETAHNGRNAVGNCLTGMSKLAYGFKWEFENKNEDLEGEIWKEVVIENVDTKGRKCYVSNLGRFKNSSGIIKDNYKVHNDYIKVFAYHKIYALHRLIALAFIENPENKEQVNHKDGVKLNNRLDNLEWVTNQENQIHKFQTGLGNNFTRKITQYDLQMNKIKDFPSIISAAKELNIGKSNINGVLHNKRKTAGGFIFRYLEFVSFLLCA